MAVTPENVSQCTTNRHRQVQRHIVVQRLQHQAARELGQDQCYIQENHDADHQHDWLLGVWACVTRFTRCSSYVLAGLQRHARNLCCFGLHRADDAKCN